MLIRSDGAQCLGCRVPLPGAINEPVRHSHPSVLLPVGMLPKTEVAGGASCWSANL